MASRASGGRNIIACIDLWNTAVPSPDLITSVIAAHTAAEMWVDTKK